MVEVHRLHQTQAERRMGIVPAPRQVDLLQLDAVLLATEAS